MIELKNIVKEYKVKKGKKVLALNDVSLKLPNKGMVFIIGKSGSGKSTLLNLLGLLDKPTKGEIIINNKPVNKFKSKETDFYRNSYVGFVFQDFNLIEDFNVYKNIELSLDLQKKKIENGKLDEILHIVGLDGLGKRKVNELSGGQKQRVAIGRAIIKEPSIILADEPTGNLDEENSNQIFNILKNISKRKLVVVVSHNLELARSYADRLIEVEEGIIKSDNVINDTSDNEENDMKLVKSKLSLLKSIEFSLYNLNRKKIRLAIMILITTVTLSVFGFFASLIKFDINKTHADSMVNQNETRVTISKKVGKYTTASPVLSFTSDEVKEVTDKLNKDVIKVSKAIENNSYLKFNFGYKDYDPARPIEKDYAYYDFNLGDTKFLQYSDKRLSELKLIGDIPKNKNEIVINKILADYILKNGLLVYKYDEKNGPMEDDFFPTNYDEIVNSKKQIIFGNSYLIISGIIDEDLSKYESLKTYLSDEMKINKTKLYEEFSAKYRDKLSEVIVGEDFFDNIELAPNYQMEMGFYKEVINYNDAKVYDTVASLNREVDNVFDGSQIVKFDKLEKNQVILGSYVLDEFYDNEFSTKYFNLMQTIKDEYNQKVKEREEKIKEIENKLLEDPEYVYEYPEEVEEPDTAKITREFTINYIKEKGLIGKKISLEINDMYLRVQKEKTRVIDDIEIVGISLEEPQNFFSEELLKEYMRDNNEVTSIYFDESNKEELERIFEEFPSSNATFVSKTAFTDTIISVQKVVKEISKIARYFALGFLIFTIVLFIYFIISSINANKKTIGILRALGAKVSDIYKIFYLESFIIGVFAFILSSIITYISCIVGNNLISQKLFLNVKPIMFRIDLIYQMFIIVIVLITVSFILPVFKIAKTKPIEVINKLD